MANELAECIECGEEFSKRREAIGYDTCLSCGAEQAAQEIRTRSKRIAILYNKGPYMLIGSKEDIKSN